jgi:hypothetical protein
VAQLGNEHGKFFAVLLDTELDFGNVCDVAGGDLATIDYFEGTGVL